MNLSDAFDREPEGSPAATADSDEMAVRDAVRAIRSGNTDAYARVVELYQRRLFGLALMLTREPFAAEEVAQDAFVRAFTHLKAYDERRPFYPWLATIAVRLAQNWLHQRARVVARERRALAADSDTGSTADPLATIIADEHSRQLWRLVESLPSGQRTAVILYYQQELSVRDVSRALGVTDGTVKTLLFRARQRLRRIALDAQREGDE